MNDEQLRDAIAKRGGLVNQGEMGRRLQLGRTWTSTLVHTPGFPKPVAYVSGRPLWVWDTVLGWREKRRKR